jgi:hypothetical protein
MLARTIPCTDAAMAPITAWGIFLAARTSTASSSRARIGQPGWLSRAVRFSLGAKTAAGFVELRHELGMLQEGLEPLLRRQCLPRRDQFLPELLCELRFHGIRNRDWSERRDLNSGPLHPMEVSPEIRRTTLRPYEVYVPDFRQLPAFNPSHCFASYFRRVVQKWYRNHGPGGLRCLSGSMPLLGLPPLTGQEHGARHLMLPTGVIRYLPPR